MSQLEFCTLAVGDIDQNGAYPALTSFGRDRRPHLHVDRLVSPEHAYLAGHRLTSLAGEQGCVYREVSIVRVDEIE